MQCQFLPFKLFNLNSSHLLYKAAEGPFVRTPLETRPIRIKLPASLASHTTSGKPKNIVSNARAEPATVVFFLHD